MNPQWKDLMAQPWVRAELARIRGEKPILPEWSPGVDSEEWKYISALRAGYDLCLANMGAKDE